MQVEIISDSGALLDFANEWAAFASSQQDVTPFQLPIWLLTWWRHFGSGSLRVFVFRNPECLAAVPCFLLEWNGARQLTLMGSGISDYLDPLCAPPQTDLVLDRLRRLLETSDDWDVCDWQDLGYETKLGALSADGRQVQRRDEVQCSEAALSGNFDDFWQERPRHLRRNVRRYGEKAQQGGPLIFGVTSQADAEPMDALVRLHTARWTARGETGMIEANRSSAFLADIARQFAAKEMLRIFSLRYRDQIAAVILAFVYERTIYGYLTGFDPAYQNLSLASVLLHDAIQDCCQRGIRAWNFCRGDEPYKTDWGAKPIRRCRLLLDRRRS